MASLAVHPNSCKVLIIRKMRGTHGECKFFRTFVADMENKKLTPLRFAPCGIEEQPWGRADYLLADLGLVDSLCTEGCLKGSTLSDILQTYLERLVGETSFDWYGTQFPVLVKRLAVRGRTSLHITMDDETAEQRYDAFGKTALWLVEAAGPEAKLYLGKIGHLFFQMYELGQLILSTSDFIEGVCQ